MTTRKLPEILAVREVAASRLFRIEEVDLLFSNGVQRCYERVRGQRKLGAVMIVPLLQGETLLLVREYLVGIEKYELAFPKGIIEQGENAHAAAKREMTEEIGYAAGKFTTLSKNLAAAPGYMSSHMPVVLAEDLYPAQAQGDEPEPIEVVSWPIQDAEQLIASGEFNESRSIAALYLTILHFRASSKPHA